MILFLKVKNFLTIKTLEFHLDHGLNVLTGESGSGKSTIFFALSTLTGEKQIPVPEQENPTTIYALFSIQNHRIIQDQLETLEIPVEEDLLLHVRYEIGKRSRTYINDVSVTKATLFSIVSSLVDINQQNQKHEFCNPYNHTIMYDSTLHSPQLLEEVAAHFKQFKSTEKRYLKHKEECLSPEKKDFFEHSLAELNRFAPQKDEIFELESVHRTRINSEKNKKKMMSLLHSVQELSLPTRSLQKESMMLQESMSGIEPYVDLIHEHCEQLFHTIEQIEQSLEAIQKRLINNNPEEQEERLFAWKSMARKYRIEPNNLADFWEDLQKQQQKEEENLKELDKLSVELQEKWHRYQEKAYVLRTVRQSSIESFETIINEKLKLLHLPFRLEIEMKEKKEDLYNERGMENIIFIVRTATGCYPLDKISGGELSRVLLVFASIMADQDKEKTLFFDEADSGLSGPLSYEVGKFLQSIAHHRQIVCITHSPQVASFASHHFSVENSQGHVNIHALNEAERRETIASMLSGHQTTHEARAAAEKLIHIAHS